MRAYQYYASSRSLYRRLPLDFQLPSESVLSRIASSYSKKESSEFISTILENVPSKECIILHDEIYVKKMLLYSGGSLFGKAVDDPTALAKTMLGIMVVCLFGGPKFLAKVIPIAKLNSTFLYDIVDSTKAAMEASKQWKCYSNHM